MGTRGWKIQVSKKTGLGEKTGLVSEGEASVQNKISQNSK